MTHVFRKLSVVFSAAALLGSLAVGSAFAASEYPKKKPREQSWSFSGPLGHYDKGQLQRGFKVYSELCAACHTLNLISYRNLRDLGYTDDQIKNYAAEYEVTDGPSEDGEMFERPATLTDRFVGPYANDKEAAAANNGALPPDFSLLAKARAPERGFPTFIFDIFTMYAANGPDYIYSLLTGYEDPPEGEEVGDGLHYNPYFAAGSALAMANPLSDDIVDYDDGSPQTVDQYAKDVSAFMMWAAEPGLGQRKQTGFVVMLFLLVFAGLLYFAKKKVWSDVAH
ncbi:MAG: cytochrome c1 [Pseudomonadota bacterium]